MDRQSSINKGKIVQHPLIVITKGKNKRTIKEQAIFQYNLLIEKYLNKGYKKLNDKA